MSKTTVQLEKQAEQAFQSLEPTSKAVVQKYLDRLKSEKSLAGEIPLERMPRWSAIWLPETKHAILFERIPQKSFPGRSLKIVVKLIDDKLEDLLVWEYLMSASRSAGTEEPIQFKPKSTELPQWVLCFVGLLLASSLAIPVTPNSSNFEPKESPNDMFKNSNEQTIPGRSPSVQANAK
jgi:hypothetical protein